MLINSPKNDFKILNKSKPDLTGRSMTGVLAPKNGMVKIIKPVSAIGGGRYTSEPIPKKQIGGQGDEGDETDQVDDETEDQPVVETTEETEEELFTLGDEDDDETDQVDDETERSEVESMAVDETDQVDDETERSEVESIVADEDDEDEDAPTEEEEELFTIGDEPDETIPATVPTPTTRIQIVDRQVTRVEDPVSDNPVDFLKALEHLERRRTTDGQKQIINPLEVRVFKQLSLSPELRFKTPEEYSQYLNQKQLEKAYVPDEKTVELGFNQNWLQVVVPQSDPIDPPDYEDLFNDPFWSQLESTEKLDPAALKARQARSQSFKEKKLAGFQLTSWQAPIRTQSIRDDLRGFPNQIGNDSIMTLRNVNLIRRSKPSQPKKFQDRVLGQFGLVILGGQGLEQVFYEPLWPIAGDQDDEEAVFRTSSNTHVIPVSMENEDLRQGSTPDLTIDERGSQKALKRAQQPSINGESLILDKYYKLPIGYDPVSFYSNFLLSKRVSVLNEELVLNLGNDYEQTRIIEAGFNRIGKDNLVEILKVFEPLVLKPSAYLDLVLVNSLLKYYNLDLKYLNQNDLRELSKLMAKQRDQADQKSLTDLHDKHLDSLRKLVFPKYFPVLTQAEAMANDLVTDISLKITMEAEEAEKQSKEVPGPKVDQEPTGEVEEGNEDDEEENEGDANEGDQEPTGDDEEGDEADANEENNDNDNDNDNENDEENDENVESDVAVGKVSKLDEKSVTEVKFESSRPAKTPELGLNYQLVWELSLDQLTQAESLFMLRHKRHLSELPTDLKSDLDQTKIPKSVETPGDIQIPENYAGLIVDFPQNPQNIQDFQSTLIWSQAGYQPHQNYLISLDEEANQRRQNITERVNNDKKIRGDELANINRDLANLSLESNFFNFQQDLAQANPRSQVPSSKKSIRARRSPELVRLAQTINNLPEFRRKEYLLEVLPLYPYDSQRGWIVDQLGRNIACSHVLSWLNYGPSLTIERFVTKDSNVCRFCGVGLTAVKFDDQEEYLNGRLDITREVIPERQLESELKQLINKNYELNNYLVQRFLGVLDPVLKGSNILLDETNRHQIHEQFLIAIMGRLNPSDQKVFDFPWTKLGLEGKKWGRSNFLNPPAEQYPYLDRLNGLLGKQWFSTIARNAPSDFKKIAKTQTPAAGRVRAKYAEVFLNLMNVYRKYYLANLIHAARQAIATVLLRNEIIRQFDGISQAFYQRLLREVSHKLSDTYQHSRSPAPKLEVSPAELKGTKFKPAEVEEIAKKLPLAPINSIINLETGDLLTDLPPETDLGETKGIDSADYWKEVYQQLVPVYQAILGTLVEDETKPKEEAVVTAGMIFARRLPETDKDSPVYCHYLQQLKFQSLAEFYHALAKLIERIQVIEVNNEAHSCYGTRGGNRLNCPVEDRFYYITRLARGEISLKNFSQLLAMIDQYQSSQEAQPFHQAFLDLLAKPPSQVKAKSEAKSEKEIELTGEAKEIAKLAKQYRRLKTEVQACLVEKPVLVTQIKKGPARLMAPIEWNLQYRFLRTESIEKLERQTLTVQKPKPIPEGTGNVFQELVTAKNQNYNQLLTNPNLQKILAPALDLVEVNDQLQNHLKYVSKVDKSKTSKADQKQLELFFKRLGQLDYLARYDPRRPMVAVTDETDAGNSKKQNQAKAWLADAVKWKKRTVPSPFVLWWRNASPESSHRDALADWLKLADSETEYWKMLSRISPIEYNRCLAVATQANLVDEAWETIHKLLAYLQVLRLYQIMFKNILNQDGQAGPEWPLEWYNLLKQTHADQLTGKLKRSLKRDNRPVNIVNFPKTVEDTKYKYQLILETTHDQLEAIIAWLLERESPDDEEEKEKEKEEEKEKDEEEKEKDDEEEKEKDDKEEEKKIEKVQTKGKKPLLGQSVWSTIDCLDPVKIVNEWQKTTQPLREENPNLERLNQLIEVLKYLLMNDSLYNYEINEGSRDGRHYLELLQNIWVVIARMDVTSLTSSAEIDYAIKYGFYEQFQKLFKAKEEKKKKAKADVLEIVGELVQNEIDEYNASLYQDEADVVEAEDEQNEYGADDDDDLNREPGDGAVDYNDDVGGAEAGGQTAD